MDRLENGPTPSSKRVIVVGGGWAGLSCAYTLTRWGYPVTLLEAAPQFGGRARTIHWASPGLSLDNGQHILLGAYQSFLHLLRELGQDPDALFQRLPLGFRIETPERHYEFKSAAHWPAPWHLLIGLLQAQGWTLREKWRLFTAFRRIRGLNPENHRAQTALALLKQLGQPENLIQSFWSPLLLAALTTPLEQASAFYAIQVWQDSFFGKRDHSDLLLPIKPLSDLLPDPIVTFLKEQDQILLCHQRVQSLIVNDSGDTCLGVRTKDTDFFGKVVLALPERARPFLQTGQNPIQYQPILTIYYAFEKTTTLPSPLFAVLKQYHYWVFQKHNDIPPNVIAVVLSGFGPHTQDPKSQVIHHIQQELQTRFPELGACLDHKYIQEKFAAFPSDPPHALTQAQAQIHRLPHQTHLKQLWICGDETHPRYPSTLEGAIQSGIACAESIRLD